ncbi:MAG: lipoprotein-releasing ABC transporter permease subunit [Alphaproteobacteria bacterium]|jgi:lipoprotein-releasing system permease protein|nr:lipoprotein-releasing ABC transporter permease subunit [Alphaproteobacteria bacterium]MDP6831210.1 lipoprotein-releasing ABC transporter permease subunit [Alphaproteobacteria bacterium]MDP6874959.1 lipoprotein-releasing ABC transporter permease subunit [Alphaproteobacteria bacterium]
MFGSLEWAIAARYLRARRHEGFISIIAWFSLVGIALGVATLIIVMSVMNGFRTELLDRVLGLNGHMVARGLDTRLTGFDPLAKALGAIDGIRVAAPLIEGQVMATANKQASGALVRGMWPRDLAGRAIIAGNLYSGSLADFKGKHNVVIGQRLARKLGLRAGDKITLVAPQGTTTAFGTVPRMKTYRVAATFLVGMYEYDSTFIYMPLPAAQVFFRLKDAVNGVEMFLHNPDDVHRLRGAIEAVPGVARVVDWQQVNSHFFQALQVERNVMFLILTLIILIAAFNIVSSLIMLVNDKGKAIAILRTMGATRGMIMRIFVISGTSIGVIGTLAGFALGLAFCLNIDTIRRWLESLTGTELWSPEIRFLSRIPAEVNNAEVVSVVLMALALSFLATLYPAWRAARVDPVEALRYE